MKFLQSSGGLLIAAVVFVGSSCTGFFEPVPGKPGQPTAVVQGSFSGDIGILVTWEPTENAGGYAVYRQRNTVDDGWVADGSTVDGLIGTTGSAQRSFIDRSEDLVTGEEYRYSVQARGYWLSTSSQSEASIPSEAVVFRIQPVWEIVHSLAGVSAVRTVVSGGTIYYAAAETDGGLMVGRLTSEPDDDSEEEGRRKYTHEAYSALSESVPPGSFEFSPSLSGTALYLAFADNLNGGRISVLRITVEDGDDGPDWSSEIIGSRGFSAHPVTSISTAFSPMGNTLYIGYLEDSGIEVSGKIRSRSLGSTPGFPWLDISPAGAMEITAARLALFQDGDILAAAFADSGSALEVIARTDNGTWTEYDETLPDDLITSDGSFSVGSSGNRFHAAAYSAGSSSWRIVTRDAAGWNDLETARGFDLFSDTYQTAAPFSTAADGSAIHILSSADQSAAGGLRLKRYDLDSERWFDNGSPGGSDHVLQDPIREPVLSRTLTLGYIAAWTEDDDRGYISVGR